MPCAGADLVGLVALLLGPGRLRAQQLILVLYLIADVPRALPLPHAGAFALLKLTVLAARSACNKRKLSSGQVYMMEQADMLHVGRYDDRIVCNGIRDPVDRRCEASSLSQGAACTRIGQQLLKQFWLYVDRADGNRGARERTLRSFRRRAEALLHDSG